MKIVVMGAAFVDIKGFPSGNYVPDGRNVGRIEYVHGGVARNIVEDIANVELRPIYLGIVDDSPLGADVLRKLQNHKVNTDYVRIMPDGLGTWLAVFDNHGDVAGSISKRPDMSSLLDVLQERGEEIFSQAWQSVREMRLGSKEPATVISTAGSLTVFFRYSRAEATESAGFSRILATILASGGMTLGALLPSIWVKAEVVRSNAFISPPLFLPSRSRTQPKHQRLAKITR